MIEDVIAEVVDNVTEGTGVTPRQKHSLKKVEGFVTEPKKSPGEKFMDVFFEEDLSTMFRSFIKDVAIPITKDFFADIFIGGIERIFYGKSRRGGGYRSYGYSGSVVRDYTPYEASYRNSSPKKPEEAQAPVRKFTFDDVIMRDLPAAEDLLATLRGAIKQYGNVSVSELYEALYNDDNSGMELDFTDNYIGWKNLDDAFVKRQGKYGYKVCLPRPIPLK